MNNSRNNIVKVSLALNLVLVVVCMALVLRRSSETKAPANARQTSSEQIAHPGSGSLGFASAVTNAPEQSRALDWIEVLRNQGVPEKVLARLVLANFEDRWQSRQAAAQEAYNRGDLDTDDLAALARKHDIEEENDLRAQLGEDVFRRWDQDRLFQQFNLNKIILTASETNSLYDLAAHLRQRNRDLEKARQENQIDQAAYNSEQTKAQSDFDKQLRALLGDERYSAMRGTDPSVGELRRSLRGLNLDDQQFATLLHAQQQWDTVRAQLEQQQVETGDTNIASRIREFAEKHDAAFESILGTNGFARFQKQQDSRYLELQKNASRWGIADSNIDYIYGVIQTYDKAAAEYDRKVREIEGQGIKVDTDALYQPLRNYAKQVAQYLRANLNDAQYDAINRNQLLPFETP
jgi:hypothetical protein